MVEVEFWIMSFKLMVEVYVCFVGGYCFLFNCGYFDFGYGIGFDCCCFYLMLEVLYCLVKNIVLCIGGIV